MNKRKDIEIRENESGLVIRRPIMHLVFGKSILERRVNAKGGLLAAIEAAIYLGVSLRWVQQLTKEKRLQPLKKKGRNLYRLNTLRKYKNQNSKESQKECQQKKS